MYNKAVKIDVFYVACLCGGHYAATTQSTTKPQLTAALRV